MSSQSTTQSNEGRSYEQYARPGSQPSSPQLSFPPESFAEEHRTLHEGDTGYVDFNNPFELPDTAPNEPDTPFTRIDDDSPHDRSQFTSEPATARLPETPISFSKPFIASGDGQVMPPSELFGQTQPTSALKKASPTSSRPSPNIFRNSATSPTQPTSSPLKHRGFGTTSPSNINIVPSSPGFPGTSPQRLNARTSPSPSLGDAFKEAKERDNEEAEKPLLPEFKPRRGRTGPEPLKELQPYRRQTLSSDATKSSSQQSVDSDFERDEADLRRQRARSKKERASRSFPDISVPRPGSGKGKIEVPSTNRAKAARSLPPPLPRGYFPRRYGERATDNNVSQETVADSQDAFLRQNPTTKANPPTLSGRGSESISEDQICASSVPAEAAEEREIIPETSSLCTFTEPPKLGDMMKESFSASNDPIASSYPAPSASTVVEPPALLNRPNRSDQGTAAAPIINNKTGEEPTGTESSPSIVPASSPQSTRRQSGRLIRQATPSSPASELILPSDPSRDSSGLSVLSATPVLSSSLTPGTEAGNNDKPLKIIVPASSPSVDRGRRRGGTPSSTSDLLTPLTRSKTSSRTRQSFRKRVRPSSRQSSLSLDELDKSPGVSIMEEPRSATRKPLRKSTTLREFQTKCGLFEGMVFAISFQDRQKPQKSKDKSFSKTSLEDAIRQEGGEILDDGFNSLFEFDTLPANVKASSTHTLSNSLRLRDDDVGFTALIADGHSRKVKYMQALALGIPCLAPKWIAVCIAKKEIVDWSSYLLCAGSSTILGDAIRSRNLPPYDALTAKLAHVISHRPTMLRGSKILLIMGKNKSEEKKLPYVFLAQVLGASLVRVYGIEEARAKLRETESGNDAFDWVYVDGQPRDAKSALFGPGPGERASKKRRRARTESNVSDRPPKRIRTLNDELVIQSLILGRLIEEDEMED